jgi:hypothetical protein
VAASSSSLLHANCYNTNPMRSVCKSAGKGHHHSQFHISPPPERSHTNTQIATNSLPNLMQQWHPKRHLHQPVYTPTRNTHTHTHTKTVIAQLTHPISCSSGTPKCTRTSLSSSARSAAFTACTKEHPSPSQLLTSSTKSPTDAHQ